MSATQSLREVAERAEMTFDELLEFLDSPVGRRLRTVLAGALIVSVPLVMRVTGLRRTPLGRAIELVGGTAMVVKLAEGIRDWERGDASRRPVVVDIPPAPAG